MTSFDELQGWLQAKEDEHLEFKEAKNHFDFEELVKYCAALANEGGGKMALGVTDRRPRRVIGTEAFRDLEKTRAALTDRLRLRIETEVFAHPDGRVVAFRVPSRPLGVPIAIRGAYWMRSGESLVAMTHDQIKRILDEAGPDFSAETCKEVHFNDLDPLAIGLFRSRFMQKSGNPGLANQTDEHLLHDTDLLVSGKVTYAALILLGTSVALRRHLAQAEVIFEYRSSHAAIECQERTEYRQAFLSFHDSLWTAINRRNEVQHFQDGLFVWDVRTLSEDVVREAILNAVCHRDYRLAGSVFVKQYPRQIEVVSPGGFPPGITPTNIIERQFPRNRRLAEALSKCGLVERSGQGADKMFRTSIREGKPAPDFVGTDEHQVALALHGEIRDPSFVHFLEQVGKDTLASFAVSDFLVLDHVSRGEKLPVPLQGRVPALLARGVIERQGRRLLLSRRYYTFVGRRGLYTRSRGLGREKQKALLLQHLENFGRATIREFEDALSELSRSQIHRLLQELRAEGQVRVAGAKRGSAWELVRGGRSFVTPDERGVAKSSSQKSPTTRKN